MKKQKSENLVNRVISGLKKAAAIGTLAASALISSSCVSEEMRLEQEITRSVLDYGRNKIQEGDLKEGIKYIRKISDIHDESIFYYVDIVVDVARGNGGITTEVFETLINELDNMKDKEKNEIDISNHFALGLLYLEKGDKEKASKYLDSGLKEYKNYLRRKNLLEKIEKKPKDMEDGMLLLMVGLNSNGGIHGGFESGGYWGGTYINSKRTLYLVGVGMSWDSKEDSPEFYWVPQLRLNDKLIFALTLGMGLDFDEDEFTCSAQLRYLNGSFYTGIGVHNLTGTMASIGFYF